MDPSDPGRSCIRSQLNQRRCCNDTAQINLFWSPVACYNHPLVFFPARVEVTFM